MVTSSNQSINRCVGWPSMRRLLPQMVHWWVCIWAKLPVICLPLCAVRTGVCGEPLEGCFPEF